MQGLNAHKYTSSMHCLRDLIQNEGVMALYKGLLPRLMRPSLQRGWSSCLAHSSAA